mgnify:CR=1 FL=1
MLSRFTRCDDAGEGITNGGTARKAAALRGRGRLNFKDGMSQISFDNEGGTQHMPSKLLLLSFEGECFVNLFVGLCN